MANYNAKNELVFSRQLKVERLVIPFSVVGNATSTSVSVASDEPAILFVATEGVDNITPNLSSNETATYSTSPNDTSGIFNILVKVQEPVKKLCSARLSLRDSNTAQSVKLGSSTGITTGSDGGNSMMLTATCSVTAHSGSTANCVLELDYSV